MRFEVTLRKAGISGPTTRRLEFNSDYDAISVLEQQIYDTLAEENEWIVDGSLGRVAAELNGE